MRDDVFEFACEFKHDDTERDGHTRDSSQEGSSANHGEDTRRDVGDPLADQAPKEGTSVKGRDDDSGGDFAAERYDCQHELHKGAVDEPANIHRWGTLGFILADPGFGIAAAIL